MEQHVPNKKLTLVDASGFIFRAYHALPPMTTSKGIPTHAVLGFTRMVLKLLREQKPTHFALAFDLDSKLGRLEIDPQYKANRSETPDDLKSQFEWIRKSAEVLRLPIIEAEGWEADDVIATIAKRALEQQFTVRAITSDKDFLQILKPGIELWDPMKDKLFTEADAMEKFGIRPDQMRDFQAIVGDAVDNVPKVPGVGPKGAAELLRQFGTLENMLAHLDEVQKPKLRDLLKEHVDQMRRAYKLVSFREDLPLNVDLHQLERRSFDLPAAKKLFTELELFRLVQDLPKVEPEEGDTHEITLTGTADLKDALLVEDAAGLQQLAKRMQSAPLFSVVPVYEGNPHTALLQGLAFAFSHDESHYVPRSAWDGAGLEASLLKAFVGTPARVIAYDGKALMHVLFQEKVPLESLRSDVMLLSYLLNPSRRSHALSDLVRERLNLELPTADATLNGLSHARIAKIFSTWAVAIWDMYPTLLDECEKAHLLPLANDLELPLIPIVAQMERAGVLVDVEVLSKTAIEVDKQCDELLAEVYRIANRRFNVASPSQLAVVLFDELKLPVIKKGKTGPSTDHEVLEKLAEQHPLPRTIIEYRNVSKLKSTYLDTLPHQLGRDGRIHTTMDLTVAATGRFSSSDPNLQNIPIRTALGKEIRRAFVAPAGWKLVSADYSQIELRILAHVSEDATLLKAFSTGIDVHSQTAAEVFGVAVDAVTDEQRRAAKMVNYGIAYGLSSHGLSSRLNIPVKEAKDIIDRYFARFVGIKQYLEQTVSFAKSQGYVESLFGRRRYVPDILSKNRNVSMAAERAAINMPIQGTAADIIKRAMLTVSTEFRKSKLQSRMVLQVHDELLFEALINEVDATSALAKKCMEAAASLKVSLDVDVGVGTNWAEAH